jgi:hypothetical protein
VPISVIAGFKKIKALVHNNTMLAAALRTSSKLVSLSMWQDTYRLFSVVITSLRSRKE